MDKLNWFKFSISDWMMGRIMKCPEVTQARFIRLCCLYWNRECSLSVEDATIEVDEEHLNILVAKKIVKIADENIIINFLDEQAVNVNEKSEKRRKAVNERWKKNKISNSKDAACNAGAIQTDTNVLQNDTEERRVEESRVDKSREEEEIITPVVPTAPIDFVKFIDGFNGFASRSFRVTEKVKTALRNRLKKYTKVEIMAAIATAHKDQYHIDTKFQYLTPEFILREDKLEKFLNQQTSTEPGKSKFVM